MVILLAKLAIIGIDNPMKYIIHAVQKEIRMKTNDNVFLVKIINMDSPEQFVLGLWKDKKVAEKEAEKFLSMSTKNQESCICEMMIN